MGNIRCLSAESDALALVGRLVFYCCGCGRRSPGHRLGAGEPCAGCLHEAGPMGPIHALALRGAHGRPRKPVLAAVSRTTLSLRFQTPWCSCTEGFTYLNLFVSVGAALHLRCSVGCSFYLLRASSDLILVALGCRRTTRRAMPVLAGAVRHCCAPPCITVRTPSCPGCRTTRHAFLAGSK